MKYVIPITAILSITALAITAMLNGINGAALLSASSLIAGIAGYTIGKKRSS